MKDFCLLLAIVFKLFAWPLLADTIPVVIDASIEKKTLLVNFERNCPPFEFLNEKGEPDGFNVELFREVMKRLNQPYKFIESDWNDIMHNFEEKKTNLIMGISNTPRRKKFMNFTIPHSEIYLEIVSPKQHPIKTVEELRGKKVIIQHRDWAHEHLLNSEINAILIPVNTVQEGLDLLKKGVGDAFFCTNIVMRLHKDKNRFPCYHIERADIDPMPFSMGVQKEEERLLYLINRTLYDLKEEGKFDELYQKWLGVYGENRIPQYVKNLLATCCFIAFLLFGFVVMLRKRVKKATYGLYKSQQQIKEANQQLYLVLKSGQITPFTWDIATDILTVSYRIKKDNFENAFEEKVKSDIFINYFEPDQIRLLHTYFKKVRAGNENPEHLELRTSKLGKVIYFDLYMNIHRKDEDGNVQTAVGYIQDITARKKTELDLAEAKDKAERSDRFKSAFIANMSHEIRTPLNSIVGFSQLMHYAETEEEKDTYMEVIQQNNNQLLRLINDVLDLSKIEAGYIELIDKAFYVNEFMEELYQNFSDKISKDVYLLLDKHETDCFIEFDKDRLTQIMSTLLSNAFKFTSSGRIIFGYEIVEDGICFYVEDTGIGIDDEHQQQIFERFEKVNPFAPGGGLGLSICKSIIDSAGGKISLTSKRDKGSRFEVVLPCQPEVVDLTVKNV